MKKAIIIVFVLIGNMVLAQSRNELKLLAGINRVGFPVKYSLPVSLPDLSISNLEYESSDISLGWNFSIIGGFSISKNNNWRIMTGFQRQSFEYNVSARAVGSASEYQYQAINNVKQLDIPILVSYIKRKEKFSYGVDGGIFKTLHVSSESTVILNQVPPQVPDLSNESSSAISGFVKPLEKISFYMAPFARIKLSDKLSYELQTFFRFQNRKGNNYEYNKFGNPAIGQWGLNTGLVFEF